MTIVMVMLVFIVYCDACDTTCCCVLFKCYSLTFFYICTLSLFFMCGTHILPLKE